MSTEITEYIPMPPDSQWSYHQLNFTFGTLSLGWPVLLGVAFAAFVLVCRQRDAIWARMRDLAPAAEPGLLDPGCVDLAGLRKGNMTLGLLLLLPPTALVLHAAAPLVQVGTALATHEEVHFGLPGTLFTLVCTVRLVAVAYAAMHVSEFRRSARGFFGAEIRAGLAHKESAPSTEASRAA